MHFLQHLLLLITATFTASSFSSRSILDIIRNDDNFTIFRSLLFRYDGVELLHGNVTVFVPTNGAFTKYSGVLDKRILLNHIINWTLPLEMMDTRTRIVTQKSYPALFVARGVDFVYVNNAKIDLERSKFVAMVKTDGVKDRLQLTVQMLYVIDEVLAPVLVTPSNKPAKAIDFIQSRLHDFSHFFSAIVESEASLFYNTSSRNTYFIPLNTRFSGLHKNKIDMSVIKGHIVPHHALFTRPSSKNFPFPTINHQPYLNVDLRFYIHANKFLVESTTFSNASTTTTTAEIVEANIPVENGVVHVINTTLVVVKQTTNPFPYLTMDYKLAGDPALSFSNTLTEKAGFYGILAEENIQLTFFVPRDEAWLVYSEKGKHVLEYCARIFFRKQMVVGETAYMMKDLELLSQSSDVTLHSTGGMISFRVKRIEDDYYLLWMNRTILVYKSDYFCVNGIVHIVDAPFLTQCDLISCRKQYAKYLRKITKTW